MAVDKFSNGVLIYWFSTLARDGSVLNAVYPSITIEMAVPA
jgi:hypothetical protein